MTQGPKTLVYFERWTDPVAEEILGRAPGVALARRTYAGDADENLAVLGAAHGYQLQATTEIREPYMPNRALIQRCPNLLAFSVTGAGYDMVDVDACTEAGIMVVNQSGANAESVAQHVIGLMLSLSKQIVQSDKRMRVTREGWTRWDYRGRELTEKTLGIVGLGNVGRRLAALAKAFNMRVIACDPYITADDFHERGADPVSLGDVFADADFVSINCPLNEETRGMIGAKHYALMKPTAYFITTARGGIHDEDALAQVLAKGGIAGAGLDVFAEEPPAPDHPLMAFENVVVSPHNAGVTEDCGRLMARYAAEQWIAIFQGERPPRLVNPDVWPRARDRFRDMFGIAA